MALEIHFDGASRGNPGPAAACVIIRDQQKRRTVLEAGYFLGKMTNNQAEYNALLIALHAATKSAGEKIRIRCDSELIVKQLLGEYRVKSPDLKPLYEQAIDLLQQTRSWSIEHVKRHLNSHADALANKALDAGGDIVQIDLLHSRAPRPRSAPPQPKLRSVEVKMIQSPGKGVCPAGCEAGDTFVFAETVPAELCVRGCAAVLGAVIELQEGGSLPEGQTITCDRKGCGAAFVVTGLD